jgi:putative radical SAM enzyme (TIGR03279 family)
VVRIAHIEAGSIAEELQLEIGTRIVRINGERVRDGIDLTFLLSDPEVALEAVSPTGESLLVEIDREPGEAVGIIPAPDPVRECANKCVFCFIDGNPEEVRRSLWLRDDDFRLSFTYGSYVTLTNLGPKGLQRLVEQKISPLYVSVHATEPGVRARLLGNDRAGLIMDQLRLLVDGGLEVHTQAVLCPGWNDGFHLDATVEDLYGLGGRVRSLSVVPVGLTRYNLHRPVRPLTGEEAGRAIDQVDAVRERALEDRGQGWAFSADELYIHAGRPLPPSSYYGPWDLTENGVGTVRSFLDLFRERAPDLPRLPGRRVRILTGTSMAPFLERISEQVAAATGASVDVQALANDFYGDTVTVAGLLAGQDLLRAVPNPGPEDVILVPAEALNADELFIDSMPLAELRDGLAPAQVVPGHELVETLRSL